MGILREGSRAGIADWQGMGIVDGDEKWDVLSRDT